MSKMKVKELPAFKRGDEYGRQYMVPASKEMKEAMAQHQQHHYPESKLDGKTVPYSVMDANHKGRR